MQRTHVLQEENNELYELLRVGETERLKEEVQSMRKLVSKLEQALKGEATLASNEPLELIRVWLRLLSGLQFSRVP